MFFSLFLSVRIPIIIGRAAKVWIYSLLAKFGDKIKSDDSKTIRNYVCKKTPHN